MRTYLHWRRLSAGALAATLLLSGCQSLSPVATPAAATMAGDWRVDPAGSDDFDRKLAPLLQQVRRHEQPRTPMEEPHAGGAAERRRSIL